MYIHTLVFVGFLTLANAATLPKYIKLCKRTDPDIDKCGLKNGQEAIKHLVAGEKSLRLLPLSPLKLPFVQLENRADFQLNISNVEVLGLDQAELMDFHVDFDKQNIKVVIHLAKIVINGDFHTDGRLLILPIKADGPGTVNAYHGNYTFMFHYDLVNKDGKDFIKIGKNEFTFTLQDAKFMVENLFEDKTLGRETTRFLNENWLEVFRDFEHVIGATIGKICINIASSVFERVPFDEIFLP